MATPPWWWRNTNGLIGLYVLNCGHSKGKALLQACTSAAVSFIITARPYGCPIFQPAHIPGPCGNSAQSRWSESPHRTCRTTPPETFIIVVTLGARSGPGGPQTFLWRASPGGRALLRLVVFTMMNLRTKTVKFCVGLLMLRDGSGPPASMLQHCPVISLQYPWGRGSGPLMPEQRRTVGRRSYSPTPSEVLRLRFPLIINIHTSCSVFTVPDSKPALTSPTGWDWLCALTRVCCVGVSEWLGSFANNKANQVIV